MKSWSSSVRTKVPNASWVMSTANLASTTGATKYPPLNEMGRNEQETRITAGFVFSSFLSDLEMLVAFDATGADLDAATTSGLRKGDPLEVGVFAGVA